MNLQLANIRNVLIRLEETIIFGLIERSQFCQNLPVYQPGTLGDTLGSESLMQYLLHECERSHAKVRRYTSPDEEPFFDDLPTSILPDLAYTDNPLVPNEININSCIMEYYINNVIPKICAAGDDYQYGSSAINDVTLLQAISKRVHYGKFVAECKIRERPEIFNAPMEQKNTAALIELVTDKDVEQKVLERIYNKTRLFTGDLDLLDGAHCISPEVARDLYADWIIPLNKEVQVTYLLHRGMT